MPRKAKKPTKPKKPRPDFPLTPMANGQWAKKIRGKLHYFGVWAEPDKALAKYLDERDDLQAGRVPRSKAGDGYSMESLAMDFLTEKEIKLNEGRLSPKTMADYQKIAKLLVDHFGRHRLVNDVRTEDFRELRAKLANGPKGQRGVVSIANLVRMVRVFFKFASDNEHIDRPVNFGTGFRLPSKADMRKARATREKRQFDAAEVRSLIDAARTPLRAMILLGVNCGFGTTDLGTLPAKAVDLKNGWITFPRPKTGVHRRAKLWPETIAALKDAADKRPQHKQEQWADLVFVTKSGQAWVRSIQTNVGEENLLKITFADAIGQQFKKLLVKLKLNRDNANFYGLRHTFLTVADAVRDKPAVDLAMGHVHTGISAEYREEITDARLIAVANHVRAWLWPKPTKRSTKKRSK